MAQAAYKLSVILSKDRLEEAVGFCRQAAELRWSDSLNEKARRSWSLQLCFSQDWEGAAFGYLPC